MRSSISEGERRKTDKVVNMRGEYFGVIFESCLFVFFFGFCVEGDRRCSSRILAGGGCDLGGRNVSTVRRRGYWKGFFRGFGS